jgi:L-amino acid N-acyltransferase YncA
MPTIRLATEDDADPIRRIYAPFCTDDSHVSFEIEPPTSEEMRRRVAKILEGYPWLVAEEAGEVLGYAYAGPHRERAAYVWSVDVAVYIDPGRRGSGVGRALYTSLFAALPLQGFVTAYAGVALPNPASIGLHRAMGFVPVGTYQGVGYTAGEWQDVAWFGRILRERPDRPEPPMNLAKARQLHEWNAAMEAGLPHMIPGQSRIDGGPQPGVSRR